jgi:hypothetical protein
MAACTTMQETEALDHTHVYWPKRSAQLVLLFML